MKTITIINWIFTVLYGCLLIFSVFHINRPGNDAAGQGMESGFLLIGAVLLAAMVGLNLMPHAWTKMTALIIQGLPLAIMLYNLISNYVNANQHGE